MNPKDELSTNSFANIKSSLAVLLAICTHQHDASGDDIIVNKNLKSNNFHNMRKALITDGLCFPNLNGDHSNSR